MTSGSVDLCIRSVRPDDATKKFSCLTTNTLTGERKASDVVSLSIKGSYKSVVGDGVRSLVKNKFYEISTLFTSPHFI